MDLQGLIRNNLSDRDPRWQKPIRSRAQYLEFKCPRPKRNIKEAGDLSGIWALVSCGNTATCRECSGWANFLHVERCWQGRPAQMIQVSGFGEDGSTIAETVGMGKVYRGHLEDRLREKPAVQQKEETPSGERRVFITALALGDDYQASLAMFFSSPLSAKQIARERRRAEDAGLGFQVTDVVTREDIESAAPPALTIKMEGIGMTDKTNTWTSSGWPDWWSRTPPMLSQMGETWKTARTSRLILFQRRNGSLNIISNGTRGSHSLRISGNARKTLYSTPNYGWQTATG